MLQSYYDSIALIERLHRQFLDVLKLELERLGIQDINNVQALILFNIGDDELTVGELTIRGYYLGSNVSYNVKKMTENDYIVQERSLHDRRSIRVRLSPKGLDLRARLVEMFERQIKNLPGARLETDDIDKANEVLRKLERFWTSQMSYGTMATRAS